MSIFDPVDTLSYHASRVACQHRDMSQVACGRVAASIRAYLQSHSYTSIKPEECALRFYFLNHAKAILSQKYHALEPLEFEDRPVIEDYHKQLNAEAIRAFYYLLLICVRESRHLHKLPYIGGQVAELYGPASAQFNSAISGDGSTGAYQRFLNTPPAAPLGAFCESLRYVFMTGSFNGGFGGPAWGAVADVLVRFVNGEFTAEMMVDTVWTLSHNNGPIYNKGMVYGGYTDTLVRILDVQRSGQIVEMILSDPDASEFVPYDLRDDAKAFVARHPAFGHYVDWFQVEALGALHTYPTEKSLQSKMHGLNEKQTAFMTAAQKKIHADALAKAEAAANFTKTHFEYWPGQHVKIIKPKGRAA
jgi:hypothetical protein